MRLEQCRQNEIVRLPFPAGLITTGRTSGNTGQRFSRERINRLTPSAVLNGEQSKLLEINAAGIRSRQLRLARNLRL